MKKNIDAMRRGAKIRRLFVASEQQWPGFFPIFRRMFDAGMSVRRADHGMLKEATDLEDVVMFIDNENNYRAYIADLALENPSKIRRGRLILNNEYKFRLIGAFEHVWSNSDVII